MKFNGPHSDFKAFSNLPVGESRDGKKRRLSSGFIGQRGFARRRAVKRLPGIPRSKGLSNRQGPLNCSEQFFRPHGLREKSDGTGFNGIHRHVNVAMR